MKLLFIILCCSLAYCNINYDGFTVYRLTPSTLKQIKILDELASKINVINFNLICHLKIFILN